MLNLGSQLTLQTNSKVSIQTHEQAHSNLWIQNVSCDLSEVAIEGGLSSEYNLGGGVVSRHYEYSAKLLRLPKPGEVSGTVSMYTDQKLSKPILHIPLRGTVKPPVFSSPAVIYGSFSSTSPLPRITLMLTAREQDHELAAEFVADNSVPIRVRERVRNNGNRILFEVSLIEPLTESFSTNLVFKTNHPQSETVEIPLKFYLSD